MKLLITLSLTFIFLTGCTTIHFDKDTPTNATATETQNWHHNVVLGLIEISDPVDLEEECKDKEWTSVQTELSFVDGFVSAVVNSFAPIWYPKTVTTSCI